MSLVEVGYFLQSCCGALPLQFCKVRGEVRELTGVGDRSGRHLQSPVEVLQVSLVPQLQP